VESVLFVASSAAAPAAPQALAAEAVPEAAVAVRLLLLQHSLLRLLQMLLRSPLKIDVPAAAAAAAAVAPSVAVATSALPAAQQVLLELSDKQPAVAVVAAAVREADMPLAPVVQAVRLVAPVPPVEAAVKPASY
jgi:hypothetical protein